MNINSDSNKIINDRIYVGDERGTLQISCVLDSFHKETNTIGVYMTKYNIMELNYYSENKLNCKIHPSFPDYSDDDILDKIQQLKVSEKKDGKEYNNNNNDNSQESTNTSEAEFNKFNGRDFGEALQYFNVSSNINIKKTELGWTIKDEYTTYDLPKYSLINITYEVDKYSRFNEYLIVDIAPITWIGVVKYVNKQNHAWIGTDASIEAWSHDSKIISLKIYYDNKLKKPEYRTMDLPENLVLKEEMNVSFHLKLSTKTVNNTEPVHIDCYGVKDIDNQMEYDLKHDLLHTRYVWDEAEGEYKWIYSSDNNNK
mmetsp:Transcript_86994/g.106690  ORF Transcript_86994/g.106690 Transcript_86994/m.106690 type:complete len:313 (+) Transcript_86994:460-1398(+)